MVAEIQFISGLKELTLPIIKLTKSRNGKTGTATFLFIKPNIFSPINLKNFSIEEIFLIYDSKKISTKDIKIFFKEGKPFLLKAIFIFKNSKEWFTFLKFMTAYSMETGLSFSEKNT